jgi:creatinine amidohydrolase
MLGQRGGQGCLRGQGYLLEELTWPQAEAALAKDPVALVPVGAATKEHGRHLPLGTDYFVADALRRAAVERAQAKTLTQPGPGRVSVLALPVVAYGYYPSFVGWPGSVSVGPAAFAAGVMDIIRSLAGQGARRFVVLNTGVSTTGPLDAACRELAAELPGVRIAMTRGLGSAVWRRLREETAGTHAGEEETSVMLAVRPDLVDMREAADETLRQPDVFRTGGGGPGAPLASLYGAMSRDRGGPPEFFTASGVHGNATLATPEKGRVVLSAMVDDLMRVIEAMAELSMR